MSGGPAGGAMVRLCSFSLAAILCAGCAADRATLYRSLPASDQELFDRSRQFMTERQQQAFFELSDSDARARFVEELRIPERLARFPVAFQEAILGARVIPGMTAEAVLLAWGRPEAIARPAPEEMAERWFYRRGDDDGQVREVVLIFISGQVSEVLWRD
ncbi:MAG: hypothetical protein GYA21_03635 [Myxococcales bacterium]|nr:hypothetical protein [Myxococcales bacterium]